MNFRRIFLVKCLLLLFPSVKCSVVSRIYKAVNETVLFTITAPGSIYEAIWKRDGQRLVQLKDNKVKYYVNNDECRCKMLQNGTLLIQQVVIGDAGHYTVTVYQKDGKLMVEEETVFVVQEPVPQPILNAKCVNKTIFVKCEVDQKAKDEEFLIELAQPNGRRILRNASVSVSQTRHPGTFRCVIKNQVSKKMVEKVINCSGELDLHLILIIAGSAILFVIFVIGLTCCIRRKKTKRCEGDDAARTERELPPLPSAPASRHLRGQPQPQQPQQPQPPRPRPRAQPRAPQHPKERP